MALTSHTHTAAEALLKHNMPYKIDFFCDTLSFIETKSSITKCFIWHSSDKDTHRSDWESTNPYLTITHELWGVYCQLRIKPVRFHCNFV